MSPKALKDILEKGLVRFLVLFNTRRLIYIDFFYSVYKYTNMFMIFLFIQKKKKKRDLILSA